MVTTDMFVFIQREKEMGSLCCRDFFLKCLRKINWVEVGGSLWSLNYKNAFPVVQCLCS